MDIQIQNVSFSYEKMKPVLENITLTIKEGSNVGLVGANGVGKSTLLKLLVGLLYPTKGEIQVGDYVLHKKNLAKIREKIGYVFQDSDHQLFMANVWEDVAFGPKNYGYNKEEIEQKVENALEQVHAMHIKDRPAYKLSGGEKKLAAIATVLAMEPECIIMDEPTVALDPRNRKHLIALMEKLSQTKIIASHDLDMILDCCETTILMDHGEIIMVGDTKTILSDEQLLLEHGLELPLSLSRTFSIHN